MRSYLPFFATIIFFYSAAALYCMRTGFWISGNRRYRRIFLAVYVFLTLSYILARLLGHSLDDSMIPLALNFIGSFWLAFMIYLLLGTILLDLIALAARTAGGRILPIVDIPKLRKRGALIVYALVTAIIIYGSINAKIRATTELTVRADVPSETVIAFVSDVHLGRIIRRSEVELMEERINAMKPDLIIIGGDLFDEDLKPVIENNHGEYLAKMKAPLGVYAVPGNHEYIGGIDAAIAYMEKYGIRILRDKAVDVGPFCLLGRDDIRSERTLKRKRKSISQIRSEFPSKKPLIIVDHAPVAISESARNGAILHLSGHTHDGQFWPFGIIIKSLYELGYGYAKFGNTVAYVSSGFGTWGPPVRIGNRPEIVKITVVPSTESRAVTTSVTK